MNHSLIHRPAMGETTDHWTILGAGAMGHLLACHFAIAGRVSHLIYRTKSPIDRPLLHYFPPQMSESGEHFPQRAKTDLQNNAQSKRLNQAKAIAIPIINHSNIHSDQKHPNSESSMSNTSINYFSVKDCPSIDCLLLTVKTYQVETAILAIKHQLRASSHVFLLQNGMGTLEKVTHLLADTVPAEQIIPGSNTHGSYLQTNASGDLEIIHAGMGSMVFGCNYLHPTNQQPKRPTLLMELALEISWVSNIEHKLWLKLAVNAAINPLTALNNCHNGFLLESEDLTKQLYQLCKETTDLFDASAIPINFDELYSETIKVIHNTADNRSSMLQDIRSNKITEIEAINGYLLRISIENKIDMPLHRSLYNDLTSRFKAESTNSHSTDMGSLEI